jgi:nucleotide-binding universal stress UspA family protein
MTAASLIRTIVVPLDGSESGERAIPWAKAVAGDTADIVLLEVTPVASSVRTIDGQIVGTAETIQEGYRQMAQQQLNESLGRWFGSKEKVSTSIATGDPGEQILAVAAEQNADLIVMSSHGRGAVGRFVSGSVADRVVRHAPLPVMIVGPEGDIATDASIRRIVAPVEASPLSVAALPVAGSLSLLTGASVTVVHVMVTTSGVIMLYPDVVGTLPPSAYETAQEHLTAEARDLVDKAVMALADLGVEATGEIYSGNPAESIISVLKPGDVIVLSSHARQGLARWVIGSTSMKLIRNGQAPVVVVTRESIEREAASDG